MRDPSKTDAKCVTSSIVRSRNYGAGAATIYSYRPYGEPDAINGWSGLRFRYTGQIMVPEAQLNHYKARVYDPRLGRFLQTDPVGYEDGFNIYQYASSDPINAIDPTGWYTVSCRVSEDGQTTNCSRSGDACEGNNIPEYCYWRRATRGADAEIAGYWWNNGGRQAAQIYCVVSCGGWILKGAFLTARYALASRVFFAEARKARQAATRGWSLSMIRETIRNPFRVGSSFNKATGGPATAYFRSANQYVVIDDTTGAIIQSSDLRDPRWAVDNVITGIGPPL